MAVMTTRAGTQTETPELVRAAFDALPTQTAVLDTDGIILRTNTAWHRFGAQNGLDEPATLGYDYLDVCKQADDETATEIAADLQRVLEGETESVSHEYPCHGIDGTPRWFQLRALTFDDGNHVLVLHIDITERKLAELHLRERADELELLTGILSHDIKNPLNVAQLQARMIETDDTDQLDMLVASLDRIEAMIDDAAVLAGSNDPSDITTVDLAECVQRAWDHVGHSPATIEIGALPRIEADPQLLSQLLENLFLNAIEHAGPDVTITVEPLPDGDGAGFAVADDGPGIEDPTSVFEAGYTTAPETGTGYGLTIVENVASAHGWTVEAVEDDGARFEITGITQVRSERSRA